MLGDIDYKLKTLFETAVICENERKIKDLCNDIAVSAQGEEKQSAIAQCRKKLRRLENEKCRQATGGEFREFDLAKLIENLSFCCDIVLSEIGKNVTCETEKSVVSCCPDIIINAFLNLISNSARFGNDNFIEVTLKNKPDYTLITVTNSGTIDFEKDRGAGITAAANTAFIHHGRLLYAAKDNLVQSYFSVSKNEKTEKKYEVPDYSAFLADEFSPVQIGLSDVSNGKN